MKRAPWILLGLAVFCTPLFLGWNALAWDSTRVEKSRPKIPFDLPLKPNFPEAGSIERTRPQIPRNIPIKPRPAEAGSGEKARPTIPQNIPIRRQPAESGSTEKARPTIPRFNPQPRGAESGSTEKTVPGILPIDPQGAESGSGEKFDPTFPQADDVARGESGSQEKPGIVVPLTPGPSDLDNRDDMSGSGGSASEKLLLEENGLSDDKRHVSDDSPPLIITTLPELILPVILLVVGFFVAGWALFRLGLFNPYTANIWPKRLELCLEIALRTDDFMTAFHEGNFSKCQMSLDALNHLNGRRSIILSNEINAAVNRFVEQAVDSKVSKNSETFQKELGRRYESVIEALRTGTRQEGLSLEVLRSLTKAQGPHRKLREPSSGNI